MSYAIGYRLKDRARQIWPFTRRPELLPRAERFFARWGVMSVVLCRFVSPLRATIPLLCGIFEMAFGRSRSPTGFPPSCGPAHVAPGTFLGGWLH